MKRALLAADQIELDVICFKWKPRPGYRSYYAGRHVNVLRNMVERNCSIPHRFSCITDDPTGIDKDIRIIKLWKDFADMKNPSFHNGPNCYRRLKAFSAEAREIIGPRFVALDLDCVIVGDVTPLWDRREEFIIWGDSTPAPWYNGSMWLMTAGSRRIVYDTFDPATSPLHSNRSGQRGSDQGWISYCLGRNEATWTRADGVLSYRNHLGNGLHPLPRGARIVIFHGNTDPWSPRAQRIPWVKEHYR